MLGVGVNLDRVADHVQHAAALQARAETLVVEMHRHRDADAFAGNEALEVDVLWGVGDRVELHVADQRARGVAAADVDLVLAGLPAGALQLAQHGAWVERDEGGGLFGPVDDSGHFARPPSRPRRPLTGPRACLGLDRHSIGHGTLL